VTKLATVMKL